jgi:hypothetical protein
MALHHVLSGVFAALSKNLRVLLLHILLLLHVGRLVPDYVRQLVICIALSLSLNLLRIVLLLQVGRLVPDYVRQLVASIAPNGQQLVAAFGIPDHLVAAPIAGQWELYNTYDNQGELTANRQ